MASTPFSAILRMSHNFTGKFLLLRPYCSASTTTTTSVNLYSRILFGHTPTSHDVVPVLDNWVQEGKTVKDDEIRRIIKVFRSRKRFPQALQVSEWMTSKGLCTISPSDLAVQLELIGRVRGLESAESYFQNSDKTEKLHGAFLNCYVMAGSVDKSLLELQKMKDMGFVSPLNYNNIMCLYTRTDQHEKVPGVLAMMKEEGVSPDTFSYRLCLNSYGARSEFKNMEKLLEEVEREDHINLDWLTYSTVASAFIKAGMKEKALVCLKKCEDKADKGDRDAYNHLISNYASVGEKGAMMRLWKLLKKNCKKQLNKDYITMLGGLVKVGELELAEKLLGEWELSKNAYDFRVPNTLLIGYCQRGLIEKAETMLRSLAMKGKTPIPNSWSIIASGHIDNENMKEAFQCFKEALAAQAENKGWTPKPYIVFRILSWATDNRDVEEVEDFVNSLKNVMAMDRDMYLSLIKVYVRSGKEVDGVLESMKADNIELDEEMEEVLNSRLQH